jgi:pimeloyl-ACP methyl ester carboxylesterase
MSASWPAVISVAALATAAAAEALTERRDRRRFPPPGRLVDIGGRRLHLQIEGQDRGLPAVVLDAGMVSFSSNWAWVQPAVANVTRVVAVDRAGLGWSDQGPRPRDAGASARDLRRALLGAGIPGPYVLVGHSYGGLTSLAFVALFPDEVAGVVLVDGSHPDQWAEFGASSWVLALGTGLWSVLARFGFCRILPGEFALLGAGLPELQENEIRALASTPRALATSASAAASWDSRTRPLVNRASGLGDLPMTVLSVTEQPRKAAELTRLQARLVSLSTRSEHITVRGAHHEGLISQAEYAAIVADTIIRVVRRVGRQPTGHQEAS